MKPSHMGTAPEGAPSTIRVCGTKRPDPFKPCLNPASEDTHGTLDHIRKFRERQVGVWGWACGGGGGKVRRRVVCEGEAAACRSAASGGALWFSLSITNPCD